MPEVANVIFGEMRSLRPSGSAKEILAALLTVCIGKIGISGLYAGSRLSGRIGVIELGKVGGDGDRLAMPILTRHDRVFGRALAPMTRWGLRVW